LQAAIARRPRAPAGWRLSVPIDPAQEPGQPVPRRRRDDHRGRSAAAGADGGYDLAEPNSWDSYQDFDNSHWHNSLIWGEDLENIAILGPGRIWGLSKGYGPGAVAEEPGVASKSIAIKNCRNVTLRDFPILHSGHFGILATGIDNLKIDTNRDGVNIDCCRNVRVANCSIN
jgi:polygalacturonase